MFGSKKLSYEPSEALTAVALCAEEALKIKSKLKLKQEICLPIQNPRKEGVGHFLTSSPYSPVFGSFE